MADEDRRNNPAGGLNTNVAGGFNLFPTGVGGFLSSLGESITKQTAADKAFAEKTLEENKVITDSAQELSNFSQESLNRLDEVHVAGERSRALANSNDIFDRISLIGEQALDPKNYTAKGRSAQTAEIGQELSARAQIHGVTTLAAQARVQEAEAQRNLAVVGLNAGFQTLQAQVQGLTLASQGIAANEALRSVNLSKLSLDDVNKASIGPTPANGLINLNGFDYTPLELRERQKSLEARGALALLSPQVTDPEYATKLNVQHSLSLATMNYEELNQVRNAGYTMPDGTQVAPGVWQQEYQRKQVLMQNDIMEKQNRLMIDNQVPMMLDDGMKLMKQTDQYVMPGTPLSAARTAYQSSLQTAAQIASTDTTQLSKVTSATILQKSQENYVGALAKEAERKAGGDKDFANLYLKQMTGQEINSQEIADVFRERYIGGKGFGDLLPMEQMTKLRRDADKRAANLQIEQGKNIMLTDKKSDKEIREQAFNEAFQELQGNTATKTANQMQQYLTTRTDNPAIKAGMVPQKVMNLQIQAQIEGLKQVQMAYKLTDAQVDALKRGDAVGAGVTPNQAAKIADEANLQSIFAEYDLYEKEKPGLGYEMQQWIGLELPNVSRNYASNLKPMERSVVGDALFSQSQDLANRWLQADESAAQRADTAIKGLQTGAKKPENSWMLMLNMSDRLTDSQKQAVYYDVLTPAISAARSQGFDDEKTAAVALQALNGYKSDDPTMMAAVKGLQREMPSIIDKFGQMWAATMIMGQTSQIYGRRVSRDPVLANDRLRTVIPWAK